MEVAATNADYNQSALRIGQAGTRGGAASIRIDDPNPDIELIETDQMAPAGSMRSPFSRTNSGSMAATPLILLVVFQRLAARGNLGIRITSQFGGGQGVMAIANAAVAPSGNPAAGGIVYVEDGALKIGARMARDGDCAGLA